MGNYNFDVDIVIPWVDGSDPKWLNERNFYLKQVGADKNVDAGINRYRDWDILHYLFRGIEKYAPWVRKVFFVTYGHIPTWLNTQNKKLVVIKHSDFIPAKYLPVFSSIPIELNMHRIKDLSEHFIYFNDDMLLTKVIKKSDYFNKKGFPKYPAIEKAPNIKENLISCSMTTNNIYYINQIFNKKRVKHFAFSKWYLSGVLPFVFNAIGDFIAPSSFVGIYSEHIPSPFLKSEIIDCWDKLRDVLDASSTHKFRTNTDVNQYLFKYYIICKNKFSPSRIGRLWNRKIFQADLNRVCDSILKQKKKNICIFDDAKYSFEEGQPRIKKAFESILPEKSTFEK